MSYDMMTSLHTLKVPSEAFKNGYRPPAGDTLEPLRCQEYCPRFFGSDPYRLERRQPAATASCSVQNQRSPAASSITVSS